jgi:hypothetical protein
MCGWIDDDISFWYGNRMDHGMILAVPKTRAFLGFFLSFRKKRKGTSLFVTAAIGNKKSKSTHLSCVSVVFVAGYTMWQSG